MDINEISEKIEQTEDKLMGEEEKKRKKKMLVSGRSVFEIIRLKRKKNNSCGR